jgi:hypothetical protein
VYSDSHDERRVADVVPSAGLVSDAVPQPITGRKDPPGGAHTDNPALGIDLRGGLLPHGHEGHLDAYTVSVVHGSKRRVARRDLVVGRQASDLPGNEIGNSPWRRVVPGGPDPECDEVAGSRWEPSVDFIGETAVSPFLDHPVLPLKKRTDLDRRHAGRVRTVDAEIGATSALLVPDVSMALLEEMVEVELVKVRLMVAVDVAAEAGGELTALIRNGFQTNGSTPGGWQSPPKQSIP